MVALNVGIFESHRSTCLHNRFCFVVHGWNRGIFISRFLKLQIRQLTLHSFTLKYITNLVTQSTTSLRILRL
jgi:hypothetical protein